MSSHMEKESPDTAAVSMDHELATESVKESGKVGTADDQHDMYRLGKEQKFRVSEDLPLLW
jgi:hypothetical protein